MPNKKKKTVKVEVKKMVVHHPDCPNHPKNKYESVEESQRRLALINDNHRFTFEDILWLKRKVKTSI